MSRGGAPRRARQFPPPYVPLPRIISHALSEKFGGAEGYVEGRPTRGKPWQVVSAAVNELRVLSEDVMNLHYLGPLVGLGTRK